MPGTACEPRHEASRRARSSSRIASAADWSPSSASMSACWMNAAVQDTELTTSRSIAGLIAGGMIPQPARQPVIA